MAPTMRYGMLKRHGLAPPFRILPLEIHEAFAAQVCHAACVGKRGLGGTARQDATMADRSAKMNPMALDGDRPSFAATARHRRHRDKECRSAAAAEHWCPSAPRGMGVGRISEREFNRKVFR